MMRARARASATREVSNGDPAAAPLLGDGGGGAGAAGWIEHQIAGVSGHHDAALDDFGQCLDHIDLVARSTRDLRIRPGVRQDDCTVVIEESQIPKRVGSGDDAPSFYEPFHAELLGLPVPRWKKRSARKDDFVL